jgi:hypothetical protein
VFREQQLYAKLRNFTFYKIKMHYLGHIVLGEGIVVDLEKIEVTKSCTTPKNVS